MTKILMIIAKDGFRDEEFLEPYSIFEEKGFKITVASKTAGPCKGKLGADAVADIGISEAVAQDYDAVVFIGGPGSADFFEDNTALDLASAAYKAEKIIAAICIAPTILANVGMLENKKATAYPSEKEHLLEMKAEYIDDYVVVDGNIVTANGPAAAKKFGETIANMLNLHTDL